jgi:riboflavin synthase
MFTGIVTATGTVADMTEMDGDMRLRIDSGALDMTDVAAGDSISVNGVCLTATGITGREFQTDVSAETLSCTTLGGLVAGSRVNLEKAMRLGDRLGGHLVSGHCDGMGTVLELEGDARSVRLTIQVPPELVRYICRKGSICVDGVSLTVNEVTDNAFGVNIIPHTLNETIFADYVAGTRVNLEVDIIARYLERLNYPHT